MKPTTCRCRGLRKPSEARRPGPGRVGAPARKAALLCAFLVVSLAPPAHAQDSGLIGERVRLVRRDGKTYKGTVTDLTPVTVHLQIGSRAPVVVDRSRIFRVERSLGRQGRAFGRFFCLGFLTSVGVGVIIDLAPKGGSDPTFATVGGAVVGIPVGILAGIFMRTEEWEPISFPRASNLSLSVSPGGGIGIRVGWPLSWRERP